jgi:hypothetical protein
LHSDAKKTTKSLRVKPKFMPQIGLEINKTFFATKSIVHLNALCHGSVPIQLTYPAAVLIIKPALASQREPSGLVTLTDAPYLDSGNTWRQTCSASDIRNHYR